MLDIGIAPLPFADTASFPDSTFKEEISTALLKIALNVFLALAATQAMLWAASQWGLLSFGIVLGGYVAYKFVSLYLSSARALKKIRGVSIPAIGGLEFDFNNPPSINEILDKIAGWSKERFIIVVDEAQKLMDFKEKQKMDFLETIAASYDNYKHKNLVYLLTGSEVGLLKELESESIKPRTTKSIFVKPFKPEMAKKFLETAAKQIKLVMDENAIDSAVTKLDGVAGRLVDLGHNAKSTGKMNDAAIEETLKKGVTRVTEDELTALKNASSVYIDILSAMSLVGDKTNLTGLQEQLKKTRQSITAEKLKTATQDLADWGYLENENGLYAIVNPIIKTTLLLRSRI